jgi:hypothetical protein
MYAYKWIWHQYIWGPGGTHMAVRPTLPMAAPSRVESRGLLASDAVDNSKSLTQLITRLDLAIALAHTADTSRLHRLVNLFVSRLTWRIRRIVALPLQQNQLTPELTPERRRRHPPALPSVSRGPRGGRSRRRSHRRMCLMTLTVAEGEEFLRRDRAE